MATDYLKVVFYLAALFNSGVILVSRGFSEKLGEVDPLFSSDGCKCIVLWGMAYASIANRYDVVPLASLVFALEKFFYAKHWIVWTKENDVNALIRKDPLTGLFFSAYGAGDAAFGIFFAYVALRFRQNMFNSIAYKIKSS
uniref:Uncharacterized protein n=1 Tax=Aplanochytrium stocchinoi TaxID=215587 RepID=A0A7S3V268_9STRA|mmetsp:Transcript_92/g.80  ORF Transcript_92/g.80 Transcript_92/m.80 type:complete len:141 (+) Transcript_92:148-570(+)|eukprot:CAMPEP_0204824276 /NCGR_PEP_ID=MMETSP1346-20131115/2308_1 /ASSEMBLY_ACC=CAM_ASM_000771 /TAXON_ID=215587 /ORGANISM="Aplanochytrium stocchinoi, Strain GSBS06" /LENGTH=140 /DNA_ID=CAMNT_0051951337 /DNA_START=82 /DNA_END=504 /DNA_ORIENTATION=-